jgi:hypothetical protein
MKTTNEVAIMDTYQYIDLIISASALMISSFALIFIAISIRYSARQTYASVLAEFSARYYALDKEYSKEWRYFSKSYINDNEKEKYFEYLEKYMNIFHQEYELKRMRAMDVSIWEITKRYAKKHATGPYFTEFWDSENGRVAFQPNKKFTDLVDRLRQ